MAYTDLSMIRLFDIDPADANLTGFASNVTGATWALTATSSGDGLAHQVSVRNDSANSKAGINITFVGTDANGNAQTETIAGPAGNATVETTGYYLTLTSVTPASTWGADTGDIGWVDEVATPIFNVNWGAEDVAALSVIVTGTIDFTLQQTFDDLQGTIVWQTVPSAGSQTAGDIWNTTGGATAGRLLVNSYSSGAEIRLNVNPTLISNSAGNGGGGGGGSSDVNVAEWGGSVTSLGLKARAASVPTVIADINAGEYETVAASATAQVLGPTGGVGDYISGLLVIPATTSPGNVLLLDNATSITVFAGGASSLSNLVPFFIPLGMYSVSGAWKVTTGTDVSVIGIGNFT